VGDVVERRVGDVGAHSHVYPSYTSKHTHTHTQTTYIKETHTHTHTHTHLVVVEEEIKTEANGSDKV